jgi:hypothetical protein
MIGHKIGIDRHQMQFNALEDLIAQASKKSPQNSVLSPQATI